MLVLLAINLSQARHIGNNRFRREDSQQSEASTEKSVDVSELLLKNLVVGPPAGAPQISLNVNSKLDDSLIEFINDAENKNVQEKEAPKKSIESKSKIEDDEKAGSSTSKPNISAKSNDEENNRSWHEKADAIGNTKDDGNKDTPKESDKPKGGGNSGDKTKKHSDDGESDKRSDDKRNSSNDKSKSKSNDDSNRGKRGEINGSISGFGYSFR